MCWCRYSRLDLVFLNVVIALFLTGLLALAVPLAVLAFNQSCVDPGGSVIYPGTGNCEYPNFLWLAYIIAPLCWSCALVIGAAIWPSIRFCRSSSCSVQRQNAKLYAAYLAEQHATTAAASETLPDAELARGEIPLSDRAASPDESVTG